MSAANCGVLLYRFVGLFLAGVFGCSSWIGSHLHMHGIDDVEKILHHCDTLQRTVLRLAAIRALQAKDKDRRQMRTLAFS